MAPIELNKAISVTYYTSSGDSAGWKNGLREVLGMSTELRHQSERYKQLPSEINGICNKFLEYSEKHSLGKERDILAIRESALAAINTIMQRYPHKSRVILISLFWCIHTMSTSNNDLRMNNGDRDFVASLEAFRDIIETVSSLIKRNCKPDEFIIGLNQCRKLMEEISYIFNSLHSFADYRQIKLGYSAVGSTFSDDLGALQDKYRALIRTIKARYPMQREHVLAALDDLYSQMRRSVGVPRDRYFDLDMSIFLQVDQDINSLLSRNIGASQMIREIIRIREDIMSDDGRPAFRLKYGIDLVYREEEMNNGELYLAEKFIPHKYDNNLSRNAEICDIDDMLGRYPEIMLSKMPERICVMAVGKTYTNVYGGVVTKARLAGWVRGNDVLVTPCGTYVHHELFHWLIFHDTEFYDREISAWQLINKSNIIPVGHEDDGPHALTNINENQATIAQWLFSENIDGLNRIVRSDPSFLAKIELMTGCKYDVNKKQFIRFLTASEMQQKFGIKEPLFYARWSSVGGKVQMDANYWNNISKENQYVTDCR